MNWTELTPRQQDILVAEKVWEAEFTPSMFEEIKGYWYFASFPGVFGGIRFDGVSMPSFTTSKDIADVMEDELERQGLEAIYLVELAQIVGANPIVALGSATPNQRCLAALRAKGVEI